MFKIKFLTQIIADYTQMVADICIVYLRKSALALRESAFNNIIQHSLQGKDEKWPLEYFAPRGRGHKPLELHFRYISNYRV